MNDWPAIITAVVLGLGTIGTGLRWIIVKVNDRLDVADKVNDARIKQSEANAKESRSRLEERFKFEIDALQRKVTDMDQELKRTGVLCDLFRRRIYQLENFIHLNKLNLPELDDWPPK